MSSEFPIKVITLILKSDESLFHGSSTLFDAPYIPNNIENRFSYTTVFPLYYATKRCSNSPSNGYLYEYKIENSVEKNYGGIPQFLIIEDRNVHNGMKDYTELISKEPIIYKFTDDELLRNTPDNTGTHFKHFKRENVSHNDLNLASICRTKYNGVYIPLYENQILICGGVSGRPTWLKIVNIFTVEKEDNGTITKTLFKSFP